MNVDHFEDSPLHSIISFHRVIESLQEISKEKKAKYRAEYAKSLLEAVAAVPELYTGITSKKMIYDNVELIHNLLADLFPTALNYNEIKAVSLPFQNFNFNFTKRFQQIINDAGDSFEINIRDFNKEQFYVLSCCIILNGHYGENFDLSRPLFYDIPDKNGIMKHYRIMYNTDFVEIIPTEKSLKLTKEDINELKKNYDNVELWREKFPKHSWILKGFGILTLFDVTVDNSISNLKTNLIKGKGQKTFSEIIKASFKSIFKIPDLEVGLVFFDTMNNEFIDLPSDVRLTSFFIYPELKNNVELEKSSLAFFETVSKGNEYFCVVDIDEIVAVEEFKLYGDFLKEKGVESFILAKLNKIDSFQGYIEVVSGTKYALHTVNSNKLNDVLPLINDTVDRVQNDIKNQLEAIIQREYTTIHPSVYWKFLEESKKYFYQNGLKINYVLKEIEFENVYPLYGETDIKGSTFLRNKVTLSDLTDHLNTLIDLFKDAKRVDKSLLFEQRFKELSFLLQETIANYNSRLEFQIQNYIIENIHPVLKKLQEIDDLKLKVEDYYSKLDDSHTKYYQKRKDYDSCISKINKNLVEVIDASQNHIQQVFPHYFERFKSDGIEHNAFIGASISPQQIFDKLYLYNLRLWQIQTLCEMIRKHYRLLPTLPFHIDLTSLILVYNFPIDIRFRLDEKRFDVSGNSDARFQVLKKRIDKANSKNTQERIVQSEFLTVVYLNETDKQEYLKYLNFLKVKGYFHGEIEDLEVEDLQETTGLRALRIKIQKEENETNSVFYSYAELVQYNTINL